MVFLFLLHTFLRCSFHLSKSLFAALFVVTTDKLKHLGKGFRCTPHTAGLLKSLSWEEKTLFRQREAPEQCSSVALVIQLTQSQCNCASDPEDGAEALTTQCCSAILFMAVCLIIKLQSYTRMTRLTVN